MLRYGVLVAVVIAAAMAFALPTASADPPQLLGGLDLMGYCQAQGWDTVIFPRGQLAPHAAVDNWRCVTGDKSLPISMEQACKWQYGRRPGALQRPERRVHVELLRGREVITSGEGHLPVALDRSCRSYGSRWITSSLTFPDGRDVVTRLPRAPL